MGAVIIKAIYIYLLTGLITLLLFDSITRRIRDKLDNATLQTQLQLGAAGFPLRHTTAKIVFLLVMWLFWPIVVLGAATDKKEDNANGTKEQGEEGAPGATRAISGGQGSGEKGTPGENGPK